MKHNDIFSALSFADDELTERAHKTMQGEHKYKKIAAWKRWSTVAACVCLCLSVLVAVLYQPTPISHTTTDIVVLNRITSLHWQCMEPKEEKLLTDMYTGPLFNFPPNMAVFAKIVEVLPDTYSDPGINVYFQNSDTRYHIVRLRVEQVITGKGIPKELYLCINANASTDLDEYDQMIFSISQQGYGNYRMINETTGCYEDFSPLFSLPGLGVNVGPVLAFTDGFLDTGLWSKPGWLVPEDNERFWAGYELNDFLQRDQGKYPYPAYYGCTVDESIRMIRDMCDRSDEYRFFSGKSIFSWRIKRAITYASEENFVKSPMGPVYYRVINGFLTREEIEIDFETKTVTYRGEPFTQEDVDNAPDISAFLSQLELSRLAPPNLASEELSDKVLYDCSANAWYTKHQGEVYGVVKVKWRYIDAKSKDNPWVDVFWEDWLYYLFFKDGTVKELNGEQLREYIGDDVEIEDYKYY